MKCPYCGANQPPDALKCEYCGMYQDYRSKPQEASRAPQAPQQIVYHVNNYYEPTPVREYPASGTAQTGFSARRLIALLLCLFLGLFGGHRFYVGKFGTGILYLFTCGIFCIGPVVDFISILFGFFTDKNGNRL